MSLLCSSCLYSLFGGVLHGGVHGLTLADFYDPTLLLQLLLFFVSGVLQSGNLVLGHDLPLILIDGLLLLVLAGLILPVIPVSIPVVPDKALAGWGKHHGVFNWGGWGDLVLRGWEKHCCI